MLVQRRATGFSVEAGCSEDCGVAASVGKTDGVDATAVCTPAKNRASVCHTIIGELPNKRGIVGNG